MNSLRRYLLGLQLLLLLIVSAGMRLCAEDAEKLSRSSVEGNATISVTLGPDHGGTVMPLPAAIFGQQGTLALRLAVDGFPSNGAVLDLGGDGPNRMLISESWGDGPSPARTGHFRLVMADQGGSRPALEGPHLRANGEHLLVVSWKDEQYEFWVDGTSVGKAQSKTLSGKVPDRFALIEPIGIRWKSIEVWSKQLPYPEVQTRISNSNDWSAGPETTLHAVRADGSEAPQLVLLGTGLMSAEAVRDALKRPAARRDLYVDSATGDDGMSGDAQHPYKTIAHAATVAEAGDTVTVMPGTYRESVTLTRSGRADAPITFRASPLGAVTLEGTDPLSGLTPAGTSAQASLWVKTGFHSRDVVFGDPKTISTLTGRGPSGLAQLDRRGRVDTIWLDGQYVPKAVDRASLRPRSFYVDKDREELIVALAPGDTPDRHLVEIGARGAFFTGNVSYIHLQGFRAHRADTAYFVGAITPGLTSSHWVIQDIVEDWGNWAGILLHGFGHVVLGSVTDNNGDDGIEGTLCEYITLDDNRSHSNDWQPERYINPSWGSGGSKFTQVDHMIVRGYEASFNHGPGIWFDENNKGITIEDSQFHHNGVGIMAEISSGPFLFRNNLCFANEGAGIMVAESDNATLDHNTLIGNKYGIEIRFIPGRTGSGLGEGEKNFVVTDISISGNILAENLKAGIANTFGGIDPSQNHIKSDSNLFFKNSAMFLWPSKQGSGKVVRMDASNDWTPSEDGSGGLQLLTLEMVRKALGLEKDSVSADPHFSLPEASDYNTAGSAPAYGARENSPAGNLAFLP